MSTEISYTVPDSKTITMTITCHQRNRNNSLIIVLWGFSCFILSLKLTFPWTFSRKKKNGKVPKRIHKSEREKMKRESLNELFLALANSLGEV